MQTHPKKPTKVIKVDISKLNLSDKPAVQEYIQFLRKIGGIKDAKVKII